MLQFAAMTETDRTQGTGRVDARSLVDAMVREAVARQASDIHVEPTGEGCDVRLRVDGLLETVRRLDAEAGRAVVIRWMVLAKLLTYRPEVPQEGRAIVDRGDGGTMDLRVSIMPTLHGPRAAVRLPAELVGPLELDALELAPGALGALKRFAATDSGMLLLTGPAGAGKTTTAYALLRFIADTNRGLSIVTLEDPVERALAGVTQIEVTPFGQRTYETALRSILRQDPQVLMLGEIRDAPTASVAVQAALSGHRLICTLHAGTAAGAIARLIEMDVAPYQITASLFGVLAQRLVRRRCEEGRYRGRAPLVEFAPLTSAEARTAVLERGDRDLLQRCFAKQPGYVSMRQAADELFARGVTDQAEVDRVLGPMEGES